MKEYGSVLETITLCEYCLRLIPGTLVVNGQAVVLSKRCTDISCLGAQPHDIDVATDLAYFLKCWDAAKELASRTDEDGRRYNMCILEISNKCDIECSTCIAGSGPTGSITKSLEECKSLLDAAAKRNPLPDIMVLSGGEPCIHPQFEDILQAAMRRPFPHVIVISNGLRLAEDESLVRHLGNYGNRIEVYLQFDSLSPSALLDIRGKDLSPIHLGALQNLEHCNVPTTLVCIVKKGINDNEVNSIVRKALEYRCVRGVTFQPIRSTGRHSHFDGSVHRVHLTDVLKSITDLDGMFGREDIIPHPQNPLGIAIGYLSRSGNEPQCVTRQLYQACETTHPIDGFPRFKDCLFFLPPHGTGEFTYENLFRVAIVCCLDAYSFTREQLNTCNIAFINENAQLVPFDTHYLDGEVGNLVQL